MFDFYGVFLDEGEWTEWTNGHLVHVQLPQHLQTKQSAPHRDSVSV